MIPFKVAKSTGALPGMQPNRTWHHWEPFGTGKRAIIHTIVSKIASNPADSADSIEIRNGTGLSEASGTMPLHWQEALRFDVAVVSLPAMRTARDVMHKLWAAKSIRADYVDRHGTDEPLRNLEAEYQSRLMIALDACIERIDSAIMDYLVIKGWTDGIESAT